MLCSRAITRERAAMSGSIAAFVLWDSLRGEFLLDPVASTTPRGLPARGPRSAPGTDTTTVNVELTSASNTCNVKSITCKVHFVNFPSLR